MYIFIRDKYEKEPIRLLVVGVLVGALITFPIIRTSGFVAAFMPVTLSQIGEAVFTSFAIAGFVEEGFKFAALYFLIWHNRNLNEKMDGIVYAVFISLGFAAVENFLYVLHPQMGGLQTALSRAVISVPSHGFFGVLMGYYFSMAKFEPQSRKKYILLALIVPWAVHGAYNSLLLVNMPLAFIAFVPFVAIMWLNGLKKIKKHLAASPFKKVTKSN
ncbi:MAG: PrsW family glutamic-type intramembrane protease [Defluviitaleaceae bacterium]|nr:PrsW family glutamic-type intramembrane protease [Defluviitaleaceae bacterium]